ncbi:response regulator transcription factor [Chloroflexus sp.]|uniref:response regulator transcription factor n=1 Tax=Chloroflexus sp. TaxID=1904827 RepID=UPI002ACEBC46|nr:response regulator transcription factor [Chloroflexus sp.]
MPMPTVLIVEDETRLRELVQRYLTQAGFRVAQAADGQSALARARDLQPDLIILDLMLPELDGLAVCRQLRTFSHAYILMLTAKAEEIDRVIGLEAGADDYLVKPFSPRELVARVQAMFRRPRHLSSDEAQRIRYGPLVIDPAAHAVWLDGTPIALTHLEYSLLFVLSTAPGRVFSRAQLLDRVWGNDYFGDDHVVEVHIANLRKKLGDDPGRPRFIFTVRGVGYRFGERP